MKRGNNNLVIVLYLINACPVSHDHGLQVYR